MAIYLSVAASRFLSSFIRNKLNLQLKLQITDFMYKYIYTYLYIHMHNRRLCDPYSWHLPLKANSIIEHLHRCTRAYMNYRHDLYFMSVLLWRCNFPKEAAAQNAPPPLFQSQSCGQLWPVCPWVSARYLAAKSLGLLGFVCSGNCKGAYPSGCTYRLCVHSRPLRSPWGLLLILNTFKKLKADIYNQSSLLLSTHSIKLYKCKCQINACSKYNFSFSKLIHINIP